MAALAILVVACTPTSGTAKGIVVSVDGDLTTVESFTVLVEGDELTYYPVEDGDYAYPLPHLRDHQRTGQPILIGWELEDGNLYAVILEDG